MGKKNYEKPDSTVFTAVSMDCVLMQSNESYTIDYVDPEF